MTQIRIEIPGPPVPERKRQIRMGARAARIDMPDRKRYKQHVQAAVVAQVTQDLRTALPLEGPLKVEYIFERLQPASYPKQPTSRFPWPECWTGRPDLDNLEKIVTDALTDSGVWRDDAQIVEKVSVKQWGKQARTMIVISQVEGA